MADSLSNNLYTAKDIKRLTGIDKNRLFYWINTHGLLRPDIEQASGTGSRSKFSFKNIIELAVIKALVGFGLDLSSIKQVKRALDCQTKLDKHKNVFYYAADDKYGKECSVLIYRVEKGYAVDLHTVEEDIDVDVDEDGLGHSFPVEIPTVVPLGRSGKNAKVISYVGLKIELGKIVADLLAKVNR